jgi:hypothetical protein
LGGGKFANGAITAAFEYLVTTGLESSRQSSHVEKRYVGWREDADDFISNVQYNLPLEAIGPADGMVLAVSEGVAGLRALFGSRLAATALAEGATTGGVKVIGRLDDTAKYVGTKGLEVIEETGWSLKKNYEWIAEGIKDGQYFRVVSPTTPQNLIRTAGSYPGPTGFGREISQLIQAGYKRIGNGAFWGPGK